MKLTKERLKTIIQEEINTVNEGIPIEEAFGSKLRQIQTGQLSKDPYKEQITWLVNKVGELFSRITELEKEVGVEWRPGSTEQE
tara:strand:+ start:2827 stop:3078 length:252 start_codon:yes stop_codon:yes gene_type:complete